MFGWLRARDCACGRITVAVNVLRERRYDSAAVRGTVFGRGQYITVAAVALPRNQDCRCLPATVVPDAVRCWLRILRIRRLRSYRLTLHTACHTMLTT